MYLYIYIFELLAFKDSYRSLLTIFTSFEWPRADIADTSFSRDRYDRYKVLARDIPSDEDNPDRKANEQRLVNIYFFVPLPTHVFVSPRRQKCARHMFAW